MHHVTSHGATKIQMDSSERDYQERLRQARAQGDGNPNVFGIQPSAQTSQIQNSPIESPVEKSGDVSLGTSMTDQASQNPDQFQTDALEKRLNMYAKALSNANDGNNDRSETGSL